MTNSPLTQVTGFKAVGVTCGLKKSGKPDLALLLSDVACAAAAVFTTNAFKAAPVLYDMALLKRATMLRGVVINAGNANAVTGEQGLKDAEQMARITEQLCGVPEDTIFIMSTGVIGEALNMNKVSNGIELAQQAIVTDAGRRGDNAAQAIMTTDLVPKEAFVQATIGGQTVSFAGMAKGSGMIHPNMGTMLSVLVTDAAVEPNVLDAALRQAVTVTFNRVTVDGDTSTNDTVLLLASGLAKNPSVAANTVEFDTLVSALTELCTILAKAIARDGEGATKLVEITVSGAATVNEADAVAKAVAASPLVKTALFGNDPNWGRVLMAVGKSGVNVDPGRVSLWMGNFHLLESGEPQPLDAEAASTWMATTAEVDLRVDLGMGPVAATVWTCDLSYKYVEINAEYHT